MLMSGTMAVISSNMQRTTFEPAAMLPLNTPSRETIWISSKSIKLQKAAANIAFMNYAYSKSRIHAADYSSVYIANLPADYDLDRCFQEFNAPNRPLRYHMCSLSTSDIVVTTKNGKETAYYVDSIGFKDVSHLLPELHEVEAQRQKEQVQDEPER